MTKPTRDNCNYCDRKGLLIAHTNRPERRRCTFCYREEPRSTDRTVYLACVCDLAGCESKGYYLGESWYVELFLDKYAAEHYLAKLRTADHNQEPGRYSSQPFTVDKYIGILWYTPCGPRFHFVMEKLLDVKTILKPTEPPRK